SATGEVRAAASEGCVQSQAVGLGNVCIGPGGKCQGACSGVNGCAAGPDIGSSIEGHSRGRQQNAVACLRQRSGGIYQQRVGGAGAHIRSQGDIAGGGAEGNVGAGDGAACAERPTCCQVEDAGGGA